MLKKKVTIGKVIKPFGIKGGLKCHLLLEDTRWLLSGIQIHLTNRKSASFEVESITAQSNLKLFGLDDRNEAELWREAVIEVSAEDMPAPADGEHYLRDLIGFKAVNSLGENIGVISGFSDNGAQPLAIVSRDDKPSFMIPFIKPILVAIEERENTVVFDPPDGLEEL